MGSTFCQLVRSSHQHGLFAPSGMPYNMDGTVGRWGLKGRRSVKGELVPHAKHTNTSPKSASSRTTHHDVPPTAKPIFGKFLWREVVRQSEGEIIDTAMKRAQHLGEHKKDVDHLPRVKCWAQFDDFSTGHIRNFLNIPSEGARVPTVLAAEWLVTVNIDGLAPDDYCRAIWQLIRCHFLLWQLGIAHGDISMSNLMRRPETGNQAVLNGFDLATTMDPGDLSPKKAGFERMGTKPFMALELLRSTEGQVKRLWCLVTYCCWQPDWLKGSHFDVYLSKWGWVGLAPHILVDVVDDHPTLLNDVPPGKAAVWKSLLSTFDQLRREYTFNYGRTKAPLEKQLELLRIFEKYFIDYEAEGSTRDWQWSEFRGSPYMANVD
ncbi:other/FunK1 protein kinase [Coprinopsis cinerea AmutBmut pab1-1]|nr:other/FunK1 protein kinase [Coprinopsis cinerea AmutBmut pab1-1]